MMPVRLTPRHRSTRRASASASGVWTTAVRSVALQNQIHSYTTASNTASPCRRQLEVIPRRLLPCSARRSAGDARVVPGWEKCRARCESDRRPRTPGHCHCTVCAREGERLDWACHNRLRAADTVYRPLCASCTDLSHKRTCVCAGHFYYKYRNEETRQAKGAALGK
jgi:hypothetical protein